MTPDVIAEAERLLKDITPGEWSYEPEDYSSERVRCGKRIIAEVVGDSAETQANAAFIAATPRMVRQLLALLSAEAK